MVTKIAVNLPVRDLAESARFFSALGFPADERLTNANTIAHVISDGTIRTYSASIPARRKSSRDAERPANTPTGKVRNPRRRRHGPSLVSCFLARVSTRLPRTPPTCPPTARRPAMAEGYVVGPGQGLPGSDPALKASRASTGGSLTLLESRLRHGPPLHVHAYEDESFYILDGSLTVTCGRDVFQAGPRSFVFLPRQVPHTFHPNGGEATVLLIGTPGGLDEYFRELHLAADPAAKARVAKRYGITVVTEVAGQ